MDLLDKNIIVGVTGGIAAYKTADLIRRLREQGAHVNVVMTRHAQQFITPTTLQALSGNPVLLDSQNQMSDMPHIHLSRQADAIIIAPCTANFMAKLAQGIADDILSTLCLARGECPLLIAPAMNHEMWSHPATQRNLHILSTDKTHILGPEQGIQACGEVGMGRMLEPLTIVDELVAFLMPKPLSNLNVLLTAGPTEESIDPIRMISNRSSGKMGYALAKAAYEAGAKVTLISGPCHLDVPYGVECIHVRTGKEMSAAVMHYAQQSHIFISVAAVADWYIRNVSNEKIKKTRDELHLELDLNPDILADVARLPNPPFCVGFAAETEHLPEFAQAKRKHKNIPLIIGNLAQYTMNADHAQLTLFSEHDMIPLKNQSKLAAARELIQYIANYYYEN